MSKSKRAALILELRFAHRVRTDFMNARVRLGNQLMSICRRIAGGESRAENAKLGKLLFKALQKGHEHDQAEITAPAMLTMLPMYEELCRIEDHWEKAVAAVGEQRARVWRLYMAGSSVGFSDGGINLHQVLGVVDDPDGDSGMPAVRPV